MSKKHKKAYSTLNYIEHLLILASTVNGCVSIFAFAFIIGISAGIASSSVGIKICAITAIIKKYKSIIKKNKKKFDEIILLLAKAKLDTKLVLISKTLIDSLMSQDKFVSINNVLKECEDMKEKIMFVVTRQILYILYQHNEIIKKPGNNLIERF